MKNLLILALISIFIFSCDRVGTDKKDEVSNETENQSFIKNLEGTINGDLKVFMRLEATNGEIKGRYFYLNYLEDIAISGKVNTDNSIELTEVNKAGKVTGRFNGTLNSGKLEGTWLNGKGTKELPFMLLESNQDYELSRNAGIIQKLNGEYQADFGTTKLAVKSTHQDVVDVYIDMGNYDCMMTSISGTLQRVGFMVYEGRAKYDFYDDKNPEYHHLKIIMHGNYIEVLTKTPWEDWDVAPACDGFEGDYKRMKD